MARASLTVLLAASSACTHLNGRAAGAGGAEHIAVELNPACIVPYERQSFAAFDTGIFRQGATIRISPKRDNAPAGVLDLPLNCTSSWSISGPATLAADRSALTIAADAPVGSEIVLRFNFREEEVAARLKVVARDAVVLTGKWSQQAVAGCEGLDRIGELEFSADRFAVTFRPFETYRDYWGTYSFDPATGAVRLSVEDGNFVPSGLDLDGVAKLEGGRLILDRMFLGTRGGTQPRSSCRYTF